MKKKTVLLSVLSVAAIVTCVATALAIKAPKALYNAKAEPLTITFDKNSKFDYLQDGGFCLYSMKEYTEIDHEEFVNDEYNDSITAHAAEDIRYKKDSFDNDCIFSVEAEDNSTSITMTFLFDETFATLTRVAFNVLLDGEHVSGFNTNNVFVDDWTGAQYISIYSGDDPNNNYHVGYGHEITFVSITFEYTC